ncbi:ABC transporter ATP-binding protein [Mucilaginibacter rubeus]|uniref:ABC transporter ATP-binding protein n=1 Tax=Mucilaginibacter rubeus TaxID=2027860 RepID=A0AAE6MKH3_9SPHI|nr:MULTISPECIES: ABC transporter ATP-binding protein [Mucilaginibacter]QEM06651.1 ABC transporter ATP-binding protein [Mucilaginibacter rubeus]QEM19240.1 ABC transporter ATP-binding protein [Mucilaginibacter gossypii]QTE44216.1 ABC transporter ATP-binding protein [Mucilaginibacter rubeus]QTE50816.1 ABC transporter ATP-binding protein [Mucilaginibacter rubeus]QTE55898.1 ABC transporter ATP-binding protein [Mucilaginibacter rubeus]
MIKFDKVSKHFGGVKAVDGVSFEVEEQENLILLGTSGCGKTTTLKMINRLLEPTKGSIYIDGKNIMEQQPENLRRGIGYVLQNNGLFPHYTVAQNIAVVPNLLKWDKQKTEKRTAELMEKLHLDASYLNIYPNELSGGQQQRIGLARALVSNPPVLLMDEPFGALDNVTRSKIHAEFKALDELKRKTIIMVTHDVQEAFELGDRICLMDKGKIVQSGTPAQLLFNPVNDFVKDFLKHQRLQLEFKAIKLIDLWELLPELNKEAKASSFDAGTNLWEALESFKFNNGETINISKDQNQVKTVSFEQLMTAFYQYKNHKAHE